MTMKVMPGAPATVLRKLGPETFGRRIRRAREESGVTLRDATEQVCEFMLVSQMSLSRLEQLDQPPQDRKRRALAYLTLVAYGFDPADFGLTEDDLPAKVSRQLVLTALRGETPGWFTGVESPLSEPWSPADDDPLGVGRLSTAA